MLNDRPALSYTLGDLPEREATLFKSFVRLIDHRTLHHWDWREGTADLLVLQDVAGADGHPALDAHRGHQSVLRVGRELRRASDYLCLPFRAADMEECLNAIGARLLAGRQTRAAGMLLQTELAHGAQSPAMHAASPSTLSTHTSVQLLRWPPPHLLNGSQQVRLATLMTGRPMSLPALCQRSGLPAEVCAVFLRRLDQAGLLRAVAVSSAPAARRESRVPAPATGLLARIRNRLGLLAGVRA